MKRLKTQFPIEKMSKVFGVTRSGYYRFLSSHKGKRAQEEVLLSREIERIFYEHKKGMEAQEFLWSFRIKEFVVARKE